MSIVGRKISEMAVKLPRMEVVHQHLSLLISEVVLVCHIRSDSQCRYCCSQGFVTKQHGERSVEPEVDSGKTSPV